MQTIRSHREVRTTEETAHTRVTHILLSLLYNGQTCCKLQENGQTPGYEKYPKNYYKTSATAANSLHFIFNWPWQSLLHRRIN